MAAEYLLQEDGASKLTLEDGSGFLLLESSTAGGSSEGAGTVSGTGALAGTGYNLHYGNGAVSGTGTLAGEGYALSSGTGDVTGDGVLVGAGAESTQPEVTPGIATRSAKPRKTTEPTQATDPWRDLPEVDWSLVTRRVEASLQNDRRVRANAQKLMLLMAA